MDLTGILLVVMREVLAREVIAGREVYMVTATPEGPAITNHVAGTGMNISQTYPMIGRIGDDHWTGTAGVDQTLGTENRVLPDMRETVTEITVHTTATIISVISVLLPDPALQESQPCGDLLRLFLLRHPG